MIRIDNKLKLALKAKAKSEGRTLEFVTNQMATLYLTEVIDGVRDMGVVPEQLYQPATRKVYERDSETYPEPTYTDLEDAA